MENEMKCCICGAKLQPPHPTSKIDPIYWGHNARPVKDGRCCDSCNHSVVIPERMRRIFLPK